MDIRTLQTALARVTAEQASDPLQSPKSIAVSLGAEAGILLSLFRGLTEQQALEDEVAREAAADALTSILVHVLQLAHHVDLDCSAALRVRMRARPASPAARETVELAPGGGAGEEGAGPQGKARGDAWRATSASVNAQDAGPAEVDQPAVASPPANPAPPVPELSSSARAAAVAPAEKSPPADSASLAQAKGGSRKRGAPSAVIAVKVPPPPTPAVVPDTRVEVIVIGDDVLEPTADLALELGGGTAAGAADPPAADTGKPLQAKQPEEPLEPEAYQRLDAEAVLELAKALTRQAERSTRDDPVLRELRDELETLRRTLYASSAKKAWIAGSLKSVRGYLEESLAHGFAEEILAVEFLARIDVLLER